jgi:hypothetical protein
MSKYSLNDKVYVKKRNIKRTVKKRNIGRTVKYPNMDMSTEPVKVIEGTIEDLKLAAMNWYDNEVNTVCIHTSVPSDDILIRNFECYDNYEKDDKKDK